MFVAALSGIGTTVITYFLDSILAGEFEPLTWEGIYAVASHAFEFSLILCVIIWLTNKIRQRISSPGPDPTSGQR